MYAIWQWFQNLDLSAKILWGAMLLVAVISLIVVFATKGEKGGYGAGIVFGIIGTVFWNRLSVSTDGLSTGLKVLCIAGLYIGGLCIGGFLLTVSQKWMLKLNGFMTATAVLFRIISVAIFSFLIFLIIGSGGNGGIIVY